MQQALQEWSGEDVTISYKPFFLDPTIPPEGYNFLDYMRKKGGGRMAPEQFFAGPRQMGLQAGLVFNFLDIPKAPNTTLAHCLIALTPPEKQADMVEAIYDAFFEHGQDVGDIEVLLKLAENVDLDPAPLREKLTDPTTRQQVQAEAQSAHQLGISGVPFYVINQKYGFSGAQPPQVMLNVLQQVAEKERL